MRPLMLIFLLCCAAACVPAETPPVLLNTPGPAVTISDGRVTTAAFVVESPQGWRVITSEATAPITITLVAPGDCEVIIVTARSLSEVSDTPPVSAECGTMAEALRQTITLESGAVAVVGYARAAAITPFRVHLEQTVTSIKDSTFSLNPTG